MAPHARTFSITTPIYYVNDRPHIGHVYTTTVCDAAARLARLSGRDTFFLTGTDEHGVKVEKSARAKGLEPIALADANAAEFEGAMRSVGASFDDFIRTTQPRHTAQVQAAFERLIATGDIYLGHYEGWYDEGQEEYVTETNAKDRGYKAFNGQPLVKAREENYYFRLSAFQERLLAFFDAHPGFVRPEARFNEIKGRVREGLQDVPFSRTTFSWGIPVSSNPKHVVYVWMDALLNYCSALGLPDAKIGAANGVPAERAKFWPADVHVIGKEILWFHAAIWPAVLMALEMPTPRRVYAHSFWISEGQKMSKTLGNFIDLETLRAYVDRYSLDGLRWYLLTQGPLRETDADFSYAKFVEVFNADLANGIGNCASRVGNMIEKYFDGKLPDEGVAAQEDWVRFTPEGHTAFNFAEICSDAVAAAEAGLDAFTLDTALVQGMGIVSQVDLFINHTRPFSIAKEIEKLGTAGGTEGGLEADRLRRQLAHVLVLCAESLRIASLLLWPALPSKMAELWKLWNCSPLKSADNPSAGFVAPLSELAVFGGEHGLKPGQAISKGEALFMRADGKLAPPGR